MCTTHTSNRHGALRGNTLPTLMQEIKKLSYSLQAP